MAFSLAASGLGAAAAFVGFWIAYHWDLPLGPSQVATACVVLMACGAWNALRTSVRRAS